MLWSTSHSTLPAICWLDFQHSRECQSIAKVVIGRLVDGASVVLLLCDLATISPPIKPSTTISAVE